VRRARGARLLGELEAPLQLLRPRAPARTPAPMLIWAWLRPRYRRGAARARSPVCPRPRPLRRPRRERKAATRCCTPSQARVPAGAARAEPRPPGRIAPPLLLDRDTSKWPKVRGAHPPHDAGRQAVGSARWRPSAPHGLVRQVGQVALVRAALRSSARASNGCSSANRSARAYWAAASRCAPCKRPEPPRRRELEHRLRVTGRLGVVRKPRELCRAGGRVGERCERLLMKSVPPVRRQRLLDGKARKLVAECHTCRGGRETSCVNPRPRGAG
jgi:hypothetical protein